jgi:hypothetical protein
VLDPSDHGRRQHAKIIPDARTKHLIFQADYPSDTPGDDSASGWQ